MVNAVSGPAKNDPRTGPITRDDIKTIAEKMLTNFHHRASLPCWHGQGILLIIELKDDKTYVTLASPATLIPTCGSLLLQLLQFNPPESLFMTRLSLADAEFARCLNEALGLFR